MSGLVQKADSFEMGRRGLLRGPGTDMAIRRKSRVHTAKWRKKTSQLNIVDLEKICDPRINREGRVGSALSKYRGVVALGGRVPPQCKRNSS
jgi:hypothetical protein